MHIKQLDCEELILDKMNIETKLKEYAGEVKICIDNTDWKALADITTALLEAKKRGNRIFTAGNG